MADKPWKLFERVAADLFNGARFWANAGERVDFAGRVGTLGVLGQCKLVKTLSLNALTALAEEEAATADGEKHTIGVVCVKVRRGSGQPSAPLVVMAFSQFEKLKALVGGAVDEPDTRTWAGS